jgi:subtilisin family serine protease
MSHILRSAVGAVIASGALLLATEAGAASYLILSNGSLPANLASQVQKAGGKLEKSYPFGVAVASSDAPGFTSALRGVQVVADVGFTVTRPTMEVAGPDFAAEFGFPPDSGDNDAFFDLQWGHNYVRAQQAWAAGVRGAGARVAVLDTGFDLDHPDLVPNINLALSADMTGQGLQYTLPDAFSHGTHVAGTIAAADNGFGVIGVAPEAELVLVKVLEDEGSGSFEDIIAGIYYATSVDADVINMSLGAMIPRKGDVPGDASEISALANAVGKAITYATQQGTTVIVSAGNDGLDLDGDGGMVRFNTGMPNAIGISAVAPFNWAGDPDGRDTLYPASYTNYGTSMVEFAAPGGDAAYPGEENCTVAGLVRPCWVFDLVFSTGNGGWFWSGGTSMAAPHAAGVAALIISANGGSMKPSQVVAAMRKVGLDLGKPGADDYFGRGGLVQSGY